MIKYTDFLEIISNNKEASKKANNNNIFINYKSSNIGYKNNYFYDIDYNLVKYFKIDKLDNKTIDNYISLLSILNNKKIPEFLKDVDSDKKLLLIYSSIGKEIMNKDIYNAVFENQISFDILFTILNQYSKSVNGRSVTEFLTKLTSAWIYEYSVTNYLNKKLKDCTTLKSGNDYNNNEYNIVNSLNNKGDIDLLIEDKDENRYNIEFIEDNTGFILNTLNCDLRLNKYQNLIIKDNPLLLVLDKKRSSLYFVKLNKYEKQEEIKNKRMNNIKTSRLNLEDCDFQFIIKNNKVIDCELLEYLKDDKKININDFSKKNNLYNYMSKDINNNNLSFFVHNFYNFFNKDYKKKNSDIYGQNNLGYNIDGNFFLMFEDLNNTTKEFKEKAFKYSLIDKDNHYGYLGNENEEVGNRGCFITKECFEDMLKYTIYDQIKSPFISYHLLKMVPLIIKSFKDQGMGDYELVELGYLMGFKNKNKNEYIVLKTPFFKKEGNIEREMLKKSDKVYYLNNSLKDLKSLKNIKESIQRER